MPLAVFSEAGRTRLGKIDGDAVIDLSVAAPDLPQDVIAFLRAGERAIDIYDAVTAAAGPSFSLADVRLEAPIPLPEKFLGIGMNYGEHAKEASAAGYAEQTYQLWFNKQTSCVVGPYDDVVKPSVTEKLDYEAELAVVIAKPCRHVAPDEAHSVIGGYMITNDVSARDWQRRSATITLGKSFDTHGPIGPWLTLKHEIENPHALRLRMLVNGEVRQDDTTANMIYDIYEQIAYLTTVMTLKPGDILATGTPSGVGGAHKPPLFLQAGDIMRVEIEGLGYIENRVVDDAR